MDLKALKHLSLFLNHKTLLFLVHFFFPFHLMERAIMLQAASSIALVPAVRIGTQHNPQKPAVDRRV